MFSYIKSVVFRTVTFYTLLEVMHHGFTSIYLTYLTLSLSLHFKSPKRRLSYIYKPHMQTTLLCTLQKIYTANIWQN